MKKIEAKMSIFSSILVINLFISLTSSYICQAEDSWDTTELEEYMNQHSTWIRFQKDVMKKNVPDEIYKPAVKTEECTSEVWSHEDYGKTASESCITWHNHLREYLRAQKQFGINFYNLPKNKAEHIANMILEQMSVYLN